jgi:hypothetical protein
MILDPMRNSKVHLPKVIKYAWGILFHPLETIENLL